MTSNATELTTQRAEIDRRRLSWRTFLYGATQARRSGPRRLSDHDGFFCDRHDGRSFLIFSSVLVMCVADGLFTVHLLGRGAVELNPVMDHLIRTDIRAFALIKTLLTGICLMVLVSLIHFKPLGRIRGRRLLEMIAVIYSVLIYWELGLLISSS